MLESYPKYGDYLKYSNHSVNRLRERCSIDKLPRYFSSAFTFEKDSRDNSAVYSLFHEGKHISVVLSRTKRPGSWMIITVLREVENNYLPTKTINRNKAESNYDLSYSQPKRVVSRNMRKACYG